MKYIEYYTQKIIRIPLLIKVIFIIVILMWVAWNIFEFKGGFDSLSALFTGLAFAGLVWTIFYQKEELSLQRKELADTRDALEKTAKANEEIAIIQRNSVLLAQKNFEVQYNFFWLEHYKEEFLTAEKNLPQISRNIKMLNEQHNITTSECLNAYQDTEILLRYPPTQPGQKQIGSQGMVRHKKSELLKEMRMYEIYNRYLELKNQIDNLFAESD